MAGRPTRPVARAPARAATRALARALTCALTCALSCVLGATLAAAPRPAHAQACCAGAQLLGQPRLMPLEGMLVGLQLRATPGLGSYDTRGHWVDPGDASELGLEEALVAVFRVAEPLQLGVTLPFVQTRRHVAGQTELGGGLGDLTLSSRYDLTLAGKSRVPGLALLAGVLVPTGLSPDHADRPLATDATGLGTVQAALGVAVEQSFGPLLAALSTNAAYRVPRTTHGVEEALALQWTFAGALGLFSGHTGGVALVATHQREGAAEIAGVEVPRSERRATTLAVSGGWRVTEAWRLTGAVSAPVPVDGAGRNQPAALGLQLAVLHAWQ